MLKFCGKNSDNIGDICMIGGTNAALIVIESAVMAV